MGSDGSARNSTAPPICVDSASIHVGCACNSATIARCAAARAHDLDEAEAVDRGALERLWEMAVDGFPGLLASGLATAGRQVDSDRPADVEPANSFGGFGGASNGELLGRKGAVDVDQ